MWGGGRLRLSATPINPKEVSVKEYRVVANGVEMTVLLDEDDVKNYTLAEEPKAAPKPANKAAQPSDKSK